MGAEPYDYFVPYEADINGALQKLRQKEFQAGRYRGSERHPATIEEAQEAADADGTGSILDIMSISAEPELCAATPLPQDELIRLFGTAEPSLETVQNNTDFYEDIDRGQAVYIITYKAGKPDGIFFAGYSFD